jgi:hypothetical protein
MEDEMTISNQISREELVLMYEFAVNELVREQKQNKRMREALEKLSKYDTTGDFIFDFRMTRVIASVALLNGDD